MSVCDEDVDLQSWGWTDLSSYSSAAWDSEKEQQTGTMSRRSLRLDDGLLDRSLPHSSASFSVGGTSWRSTRSLKSRHSQQHSTSCLESLLLNTPRKPTAPLLLNSSLHSVASDASLLSSLLDESSIQETTLVDTFWGLDQDIDPKESTIIAEQSTVLADSTLIGSDGRCPKHQIQTLSRVYCKDCELHADRKSVTVYCSSSSKYSSSMEPRAPGTSTIYCRDRNRKSRTAGVLASMWDRSAACVVSLLALLHHLLLRKHQDVTDVLRLWLDSSVLCVRRAAACCVSVLTHTWQVCRGLASKLSQAKTQTDAKLRARSSLCGVMNLRETETAGNQRETAGNQRETAGNQRELHPNGSLFEHTPALPTPTGDDCKEKQRSQTDSDPSSSSSWASVASCLFGLMCSAAVLTGKTAGDTYRWLNRRWHHMTASFLLTRFPLGLLLLLLPLLLLLFSLCWFGPAGLRSVLPAVDITEWRTAVSDAPRLSSQSQSAEGAAEESRQVQPYKEPLYSQPPPAEALTGEEVLDQLFYLYSLLGDSTEQQSESSAAADESARLIHLEQSLTALWQHVEAGGRRAEQRHREVLQLYADLQQQQQLVSAPGGVEPWLSGLLEQQLEQLKTQVDEERQQREQTQQQEALQRLSQTSRLDQLELRLQTVAAKAEEVQWRQEAAAAVSPSPATLPAAVSVGVDRHSHDALLEEVARLEAALEDVRRDVDGLSGCQDRIQETISAQVREEVRSLVYGNQLTVRGGASGDSSGLPESLLQWLSERYISGADLQASLASLELSILQNISQQLEQRGSEETVREAVLHAAGAAGAAVTQEDVRVIVQNSLRLFAQDRTGLVDYALESGGGSILSTRCSETYETKAALLSLFGVPLWYFSQSPRAVIQPDVHPGNCWAFRGSTGFLVIRLAMRILPSAFSLEHIPKALAPSGTLRSAPRDFSVYGLDDESQERGKLLGTYTYDEDGEALQTFPLTEENDRAFQVIEVQVLSNWGHEEYTCMYRFRVHGTPGDV